ncbi:MAG: M4 family metallopeptidase, partial [Sphingobacteriaceae bacterium]
MYNPVGIGLYNVETLYHGLQPITATVYLPFYEEEKGNFIGIIPAPLVTPYTTALAMCAEKSIGIYANIEVGAGTESLLTPEKLDKFYPFSGIVSLPNIKGPYNKLKTLNEYDPSFSHPFDPKVAQSIMDGVQRFTEFTHLFYDWNSYDKAGNVTITTVVHNMPEITGYKPSNRWIYFSTVEPQGLLVSRDIIGHEITHGILYENLNLYPISPDENTPLSESTYDPTPMLGETESLIESFCDIMGLAAYNWWDNKFLAPKWKYGGFTNDPMVWRSFDDPKSNDMPNTYEGEHYIPVGDPHYVHNNSTVMSHWFYILVNGKSGYIDDIQTPANKYTVYPLKKDKQASYKLALALNFFTCTQLMNFMTNFYVMRDKTLQTMDLVGFPEGSYENIQVWNAWHAVGVGEKWEQGQYNAECHVPLTAETWYNGSITFHGMKATVKPSAGSLKENYLEDCTQNIKTLDYKEEAENKTLPFADVNEDLVYGLDNDT